MDVKRDGCLHEEVHRELRKKISIQLESDMLKWFDLNKIPSRVGGTFSCGYREPTTFFAMKNSEDNTAENLSLQWIKELVKSRFQQDRDFRNFIEDLVE